MIRALRSARALLRPSVLGSRGIALPLALLGLVAVTLLVTTVLLTSGTEFAVSSGQKDASKSLFSADGALESYVAQQAGLGSGVVNKFADGTAAFTFGGKPYTMTLARLSRQVVDLNANTTQSTEVYSIIASPDTAGRGVGALVRVQRTLNKILLNIDAGATSGGDLKIAGNATISNGRTNQSGCAEGDTSKYAIQVTAGASVDTVGNSATIEGKSVTTAVSKDTLQSFILGHGMTLDSLTKYANIKFGPRFGRPDWSQTRVNSTHVSPTDTIYNWGCPYYELLGTTQSCVNGSTFTADTARRVVVAIDAEGSSVTINGDYGQGIIIVVNGSLKIQGNFVFRGIILVEKDLTVGGGGGQFDGKIEGTVVAFGAASTVEDNVQGRAVIRYNKCSITAAQNALNSGRIDTMPQALVAPTFAWFELVR
ncbi:hypothetical protein [Longimicrobium sp.]|uniref:hypothetical protein n=1 Tax=Longimicrobium sp. TaxID=2029185 RepID=UPI002CAACEE9|nr:hypothetical protein [Longimicrobium sp.]HSU13196.1 hypothetical protein [Longimicrobium sp.]